MLTLAVRASFPTIAVASAYSLHEARKCLKSAAPQLAIIDLGLPDGSGIDLITELNHRDPTILCIVATIYSDDEHLLPALRAGAQGYLLKEQPWQQLATLLSGIVEGRPPLSPAIARKLLGYFRPLPPSVGEALTQRESEVLALIAKGITQAEAAKMLGISTHTVCGYVKELYRKLNVSSRAEAALTAQKMGLVD